MVVTPFSEMHIYETLEPQDGMTLQLQYREILGLLSFRVEKEERLLFPLSVSVIHNLGFLSSTDSS